LGTLRGKKILVARYQLLFHPFPLAHQQAAHHLVAFGKGLGLQLVQSGFLPETAGVLMGNLDPVQFRPPFRLALIVHAADHDLQAAHGVPPLPVRRHRRLMIRQ